jgi:hypothetical protein
MAKSKNKSKMVKRGGANQANSAELTQFLSIDTTTKLDAVDVVCSVLLYIYICSINKNTDHYRQLSKKIKTKWETRGGASMFGEAASFITKGASAIGQGAAAIGQSASDAGQYVSNSVTQGVVKAGDVASSTATGLASSASSFTGSTKNMFFPGSDDILNESLKAIEEESTNNSFVLKKKEIMDFLTILDATTTISEAIQKCKTFNEKPNYSILSTLLKINFESLQDISYPGIREKIKKMIENVKSKSTSSNAPAKAIGGYKKTRKMSKSKKRKSYKRRKSRRY